MLPARLGIVGYFQLMQGMHFLDTLAAIIFPSMVATTTVFWDRQYMDAYLPNAIIECARIDGCGELKIFHRIVLPIITPAAATMAIFTFVEAWNNFEYPLILLTSTEKYPLPLMVQTMSGVYSRDYGAVYIGVAFSIVPIMILFCFCSKKLLAV